MPRALALTWELVRSELPASTKNATLLQFDRVFGFRLAEWHPGGVIVPEAVWALVQQRQRAQAEKRWQEANALREQVKAASYDIDDTPQGARIRSRSSRLKN
jgi:cysteinyl-tRNA synthetase